MIQVLGNYFVSNNMVISVDHFNDFIQDKNDIIYEVVRFISFKPLFLEDHLDRFLMTFNILPDDIRTHSNQITKSSQLLIEKNGISFGNLRFQFNNNQTNSFCAWLVPYSYPTSQQYRNGVHVRSFHLNASGYPPALRLADAPTFTRLFPMRMVDSRRCGSPFIFLMRALAPSFFLARCRARVLLMEKRAVSADEKKPESISRSKRITIWSIIINCFLVRLSAT